MRTEAEMMRLLLETANTAAFHVNDEKDMQTHVLIYLERY